MYEDLVGILAILRVAATHVVCGCSLTAAVSGLLTAWQLQSRTQPATGLDCVLLLATVYCVQVYYTLYYSPLRRFCRALTSHQAQLAQKMKVSTSKYLFQHRGTLPTSLPCFMF